MASTRTIRKRALKKVRDGSVGRWLRGANQKPRRGVVIPPGSVLSIQVGDSWQVLTGPQSGRTVPMTHEETALVQTLPKAGHTR